MCGYVYRADSDDSIKDKNVFSADGSNIGIVVSSLGNILIIQAKFIQQEEGEEEEEQYLNSPGLTEKEREEFENAIVNIK